MSLQLVGIVDYDGQVHCLDHASTVSSYRDEIYSVDPERQCWCGTWVGTPTIVRHPLGSAEKGMIMIGIYEAHVHVTAPDGTDHKWMRYAYSREAIRKYGDDLIKANQDTINTITIEYREK